MGLTNTACLNAKSREKQYTLFDDKGLFLLVSPAGGKWWRLKYRYQGKEKRLSLGTYPETSLAQAREKRDAARKLLAQGVDPAEVRRAEDTRNAEASGETFLTVAQEWRERSRAKWTPKVEAETWTRLEKNALPWLGHRPIKEILAPELLSVVRRIESRGAVETAHRVLGICSQVFRFAVATGRAERDPSGDLRGALAASKAGHYATITDPKAVAALLRAIDGYKGSFVTLCALRLAPLVFVRPGELRHAEWAEINLDGAEWRIPAEKMKMRTPHVVPLSRQAVTILREVHPLTGSGQYVFPSVRTPARAMSENTITGALRRLGYASGEMTGHGFRSMASTLLNEQGWNRDAVERQLAHQERNKVRGAYNFAEFMPERRKMMQAWADYLDGLRAGGRVVPIRRAGGSK